MKLFILFVFCFLFSIPSFGQVLVGDNSYRQVETTIAVHPTNPNIMATAAIENRNWSIIYITTNNGLNWSLKINIPDAFDPVLEFDNGGNLFFSFLDRDDHEIYIIMSSNLGNTWSTPLKVSNDSSGYNADKEWMAISPNNKIYITWVEIPHNPGNTKLLF